MVECQVCRRTMEVISWKHLASHGLTLAQYREQFPTAPTQTEAAMERKRASAARANEKRKGIPRNEETKRKISASKKDAASPAWNKGIKRSDEEKQHLSNVKKHLYHTGAIIHWNTGRTTSVDTRSKISASLKAQNRTYAETSKAKRRATMKQKVEAGWIKRTTYEMTPEHFSAWQAGGAARITLATKAAIDHAAEICKANAINIIGVSKGSYSYELQCNVCSCAYTRTRNAFVDCKVDRQAYLCPMCHPRERVRSRAEIELAEFVTSQLAGSASLVTSDRTILNGREIDCYVPELKVGFEYNGLYWHAEGVSGKSPGDHNWKTKLAYTKGVRLITIFEDEWLQKRSIVESRIQHILKTGNRRVVHARKTTIKPITSTEKDCFLKANHIQGTDRSAIRYGAWIGEELVAVMTITKTNMSKGGTGAEYELNRFAVARNTHIPGIASKLFKRFIIDYDPEFVISYSDRRWCTGQVYDQLGFAFDSVTPPSYWYLTNNHTKRTHRSAFMKHTLEAKLPTFDPDASEWDNMRNNGYDRIWDCGTAKFVYTRI